MSAARTYPDQFPQFEMLYAGAVIVDIGQMSPETRRTLDKLVRLGIAAKWRGKWYPVTGAPWGLGPDKTCFALCRDDHAEAA